MVVKSTVIYRVVIYPKMLKTGAPKDRLLCSLSQGSVENTLSPAEGVWIRSPDENEENSYQN